MEFMNELIQSTLKKLQNITIDYYNQYRIKINYNSLETNILSNLKYTVAEKN